MRRPFRPTLQDSVHFLLLVDSLSRRGRVHRVQLLGARFRSFARYFLFALAELAASTTFYTEGQYMSELRRQ